MSVERSDISPRAGGWTLAGVVGLVALSGGVVAGFLALSGGLRDQPPIPPAPRPAPMLQVSERSDRAAIEARSRATLAGRKGGESIDEAMRSTAAAGWDGRP